MTGCTCSYQYAVYVKNDTEGRLQIHFKSKVDAEGLKEESILLNPGEYKRLLYSKEIHVNNSCQGTSREHCHLLFNYLSATNEKGDSASLSLCDSSVKFEKVDIQQAEFTLEYKPAHFIR